MGARVYRSLVSLYPREFRNAYREDLVQHFSDLAAQRGARAAWARTSVDLIVTLPRYRLETIMSEPHTTTTISLVTIALCALGGVVSVLVGLYPGGVLVLLAAALAVSQRTALARAIRTPGTNRRRKRLAIAAALAVVSAISIASYLRAVSDEHVSGTSLVLHNAIGVPAVMGTFIFLIVGLLTPRATLGELHRTPGA